METRRRTREAHLRVCALERHAGLGQLRALEDGLQVLAPQQALHHVGAVQAVDAVGAHHAGLLGGASRLAVAVEAEAVPVRGQAVPQLGQAARTGIRSKSISCSIIKIKVPNPLQI